MAKTMATFGGNVEVPAPRTCECVLCGAEQEHDVCNTCHMSNPDGSLDTETLNELIANDLRELANA